MHLPTPPLHIILAVITVLEPTAAVDWLGHEGGTGRSRLADVPCSTFGCGCGRRHADTRRRYQHASSGGGGGSSSSKQQQQAAASSSSTSSKHTHLRIVLPLFFYIPLLVGDLLISFGSPQLPATHHSLFRRLKKHCHYSEKVLH